jgi:phosphoserine/homoserine phosphotransferase
LGCPDCRNAADGIESVADRRRDIGAPWIDRVKSALSESGSSSVQLVCLDLEGVLIPEIWIEFAERTGIAELRRTTRDEPDYDKLMKYRLALLAQHKLGLPDIQKVIADMGPMPGAKAFLDALREDFQVIILSDTYYEFAMPMMRQLGMPTLFCHKLEANAAGFLVNYHLRMPNQKKEAVKRFKEINFKVIAAGDSYNDTAMLGEAHAGILFHAPENVIREFPQFAVTNTYAELRAAIDAAAERI